MSETLSLFIIHMKTKATAFAAAARADIRGAKSASNVGRDLKRRLYYRRHREEQTGQK